MMITEMIEKLNLEPINIRLMTHNITVIKPCPSKIFSQFCVALDISIVKHTIPSTQANTATNILKNNKRLEFTNRQNRNYQRTT